MSCLAMPGASSEHEDRRPESKGTLAVCIAGVLYVLFLAANIFDMHGDVGIKYVGFALLIPLALYRREGPKLSAGEILGFVGLFVIWPFIAFMMGVFNGADAATAKTATTPFLAVFAALLAVPALGAERGAKYFNYAILMFSCAVAILTILLFTGQISILPALVTRYLEGTAATGSLISPYPFAREDSMLRERVLLAATLWLVPASVYFSATRRWIWSALCLSGLIFAVSKAGIAVALGFLLITLVWNRKGRIFGLGAVAIGIAGGLFFFPYVLEDVRSAFSSDSDQMALRQGHASSVMTLMSKHPLYLLVGQGAGTEFYSTGTHNWESRMEVDHVDAVRQYGLFWFLIFSWLCGRTAVRLIRSGEPEKKANGWALASMYVVGGTNPALMTPLFMFYLAVCYLLSRQPHGPTSATASSAEGVPIANLDIQRA